MSDASPSRIRMQLGPLQETMLISLWARAMEAGRVDAIVCDEHARTLLDAVDYDFRPFEGAWKTQAAVAVRCAFIDQRTRLLLEAHPDAVVVNLGAGLDTRFWRVDNGRVLWIDLDVPDTMAVRDQLLPAGDRCLRLTASMFDDGWIEQVRRTGRGPVIFIAEGVLMYFERERVRRLLTDLAAALPGSHVIFDTVGPMLVRRARWHDTLRHSNVELLWGVRSGREFEAWNDRTVLIGEWSMFNEHPRRWRWLRWCRVIPALRDQFRVVHLRLG